jgi:beta-fructofuranosidase
MESRANPPHDLYHRSSCAAVLSVVVLLAAHALSGARADRAGGKMALGGTGEDAGADADGFPWSNAMLEWQRTGYHFQPKKNYMNGITSQTQILLKV